MPLAAREVDEQRRRPRRFLHTRELFGIQPRTSWLPEASATERPERAAAYAQHLAVCAVRDIYLVDPVGQLARRLVDSGLRDAVDERYLRRMFNGEYKAGWDELATWALAVGNISILPAPTSIEGLLPPVGTEDR